MKPLAERSESTLAEVLDWTTVMGLPACQISINPSDQPPTIRPYHLLLLRQPGISQLAFTETACGMWLFESPRSPRPTSKGFCASRIEPEPRKLNTSL